MPATGVALSTDDTLDLWKVTLSAHDWKNRTYEYLFPRHNWIVVDEWFRKDRMEFDGGTQIEREVIYREGGSASWVHPGEVRTRSTGNVVAKITMPFCNIVMDHNMTEDEILRNLGKARLKKLADGRRAGCMVSICDAVENRAWELPTTEADTKFPRGIVYYIVPITAAQRTAHASAGTNPGQHQGQNPTGFSTCMGLDASNAIYSRWRSYNDTWTNADGEITEDDLRKIGRMFRRLHFRAPLEASQLAQPKFRKMRGYSCETIIDSYSAATRRQNDNLGANAVNYYGAGIARNGEPTMWGMPIQWMEKLDDDATFPLDFVNHDYLYPIAQRGKWLREDSPLRTVEQPDVFTTWVDSCFNIMCSNRQLCGGNISYPA